MVITPAEQLMKLEEQQKTLQARITKVKDKQCLATWDE